MNDVNLYFKKIISYEEGFFGQLNSTFKTRMKSTTNQRRKNEIYTVYSVLKELNLLEQFSYSGTIPTLKKGYISISHDGDYLVMSMSSSQGVGIDLAKKGKPDGKLMKKLETKDVDTFFRKWTIFEAFSKLSGLGTGVSSEGVKVDLENKQITYLGHKVDAYIYQESFEDYYLAIISTKEFEIKERKFL